MTSLQLTPNSRATEATEWPSRPTRRQISAPGPLGEHGPRGDGVVPSDHVLTSQCGSTQRHRGLRHASTTRWSRWAGRERGPRGGPISFAGDYEYRSVGVAVGVCPSKDPQSRDFALGSPGLVVIRSFNAAGTRNEAARSGFGDGLVYWAWGDKTISVTESSRPEIVAAVETAMADIGANLTLDKRRG